MAQTNKKAALKEARQARLIKKLRNEEHLMKWLLVAALVLILLLLLFIGYATDWTRGLRKDKVKAPGSSTLDSASGQSKNSAGESTGGGSGTGSSSNSSSKGTPGSNGTNGATNTKENSSTTNNNSTTNNTPGSSSNLYDALVRLYQETGPGDNINDVVNRANALGLSVNCTDELLVRTCTISDGNSNITVRGLNGTGTVTSVLQNLL